MSSNKLMCSHKLGINSLKLHRHSFMGAAMLPSWIQWLRWTSPLCLIIFYAWGSRPSPIHSMPKVEERKTCRRLCAVEVIFNLCLYLQTERYEGSYLCLNNWERVLFTRETKTAKDKMPSSPPHLKRHLLNQSQTCLYIFLCLRATMLDPLQRKFR